MVLVLDLAVERFFSREARLGDLREAVFEVVRFDLERVFRFVTFSTCLDPIHDHIEGV